MNSMSPSQNYLKAAWNVFDFVTVLGSITDILVTEIKVSRAATGRVSEAAAASSAAPLKAACYLRHYETRVYAKTII